MTPTSPGQRPFHVLALGRACVDEILEVAAYPAEDEKIPILERLREGGGQASTAAALAAHLGGSAAFVGVLGDDEPGRFARSRMEAFGVDLSGLPAPRGRTPAGFCAVSRAAGTRTILYERAPAPPLRWEEVDPGLVARARAVLVDPQAAHLLPELLAFCRPRGILVVADVEHAPPGWEETWGGVDVLAVAGGFLAEAEPTAPGGPREALRRVAARVAAELVCATLAGRGAVALGEDGLVHVWAPEVAVRDTTGAGDAFHGALALALARERHAVDALRFAVAAASLGCRGLGGRSFPTAAEVEALSPTLRVTPRPGGLP